MSQDLQPTDAIKIPVLLSSTDKSSKALITVYSPTKGERIRKTIFITITLVLCAAISVFIPLAHFILVPGFLVLAFFSAFSNLKPKKIILSGEGTCPACNAPFRIMKRSFSISFFDICEKCSRSIQVKIDQLGKL